MKRQRLLPAQRLAFELFSKLEPYFQISKIEKKTKHSVFSNWVTLTYLANTNSFTQCFCSNTFTLTMYCFEW